MDMITLAMAKAYSDKKGGYTEPGKKYTFDGNTEGRIVVPVSGSDSFVKISDDMPDLHKLTDLAYSSGGHATADALTIQDVKPGDDTLYGAVGMVAIGGNAPYVVVVTDTASSPIPETGLYAIMVGGSFWISSIEFAETIVPIDQKYLGGVCLPVVELSTPFSIGATFTDAENAALYKAFNSSSPFVLRCSIETTSYGTFTDCKVVVFSAKTAFINVMAFSVLDVKVSMQSTDGSTWQAGISEG